MSYGLRVFLEVILLLILVTLVLQLILEHVLKREEYVAIAMIIPMFFFCCGIALSIFVSKYSKEAPTLTGLLLLKMLKLAGGVVILIAGLALNRAYAVYFVGEFIVYFVMFLTYETYVLYKLNKNVR